MKQNKFMIMNNREIIIDAVIKSKIFNFQQNRKIKFYLETRDIGIEKSQRSNEEYKRFHINEIKQYTLSKNIFYLSLKSGRQYQISSQRSMIIFNIIKFMKQEEIVRKFAQANMTIPQVVNYKNKNCKRKKISDGQVIQHNNKLQAYKSQNQIKQLKSQQNLSLTNSQKIFLQAQTFFDLKSWKLDQKQFRYILVNESYKANMGKVIGFILKKFLSTGTFMGISLPVIVMKPESILQSYAKSIGNAPKIFKNIPIDPVERMKLFVTFMLTVSILMIDLRKAFNPVIGQTYQSCLAGGYFSAQQVSHHPPISGFYYQGKGYIIYGQLELTASVGLNTAKGKFIGDITVDFGNGQWIKGKLPNGEIGGVIFGQTDFSPYGGSYAYDNNDIICTYQQQRDYKFYGLIGILSGLSLKNFKQKMTMKDRFQNFKAFKKGQYDQIYNTLQFRYGKDIYFDQHLFYEFNAVGNAPYLPQRLEQQKILKSDCSFRKDIKCLSIGDQENAQEEKEIIENQERRLRKLRQANIMLKQ